MAPDCAAYRSRSTRACRHCQLAAQCPIAQRNAMAEQHLPLAHHVAERYLRGSSGQRGADRDDIHAEAALALLPSLEGYDPDSGYRFSSYAVPKILGAIRHHLRDDWQPLHMPRRLLELQQRVRSRQLLRQRQGLPPLSPDELCQELACTPQQLDQAELAWRQQHVASLDGLKAEPAAHQPAGDDGDPVLAWLQAALALLPAADRDLVEAAWIEATPRRDLAKRLGINGNALSQRLAQLLDQLRQSAKASRAASVV